MMTRSDRWTQIAGFNDGHKFFKDKSGTIAIADQSGEFPEDTDDGVLYLDFSRKMFVNHLGSYSIPLIDKDGKETLTVGDFNEAAFLCSLEMEIKRGKKTYRIVEV
jgi:hypothetical protein